MNLKQLEDFFHTEVTNILTGEIRMSKLQFCKKAGIKTPLSLYNFLETKEIKTLEFMGKLAKGLELPPITYVINRG